MKNLLKYLVYLPIIAQLIDAVDDAKNGSSAYASVPLSIKGKRGVLSMTFTPNEVKS